MSTLSQRLLSVRKKAKGSPSQATVAHALNVAQSTYARFESGSREPPISFIIRFCKHFNVSADYLLDIPARPETTEKAKADKEKSAIGSMLDASVPRDSLAPFDPALHEEILAYARFRQEEFLKNSSKEDAI